MCDWKKMNPKENFSLIVLLQLDLLADWFAVVEFHHEKPWIFEGQMDN